jgi:transcriptional regulator with XRE-family HTH domain
MSIFPRAKTPINSKINVYKIEILCIIDNGRKVTTLIGEKLKQARKAKALTQKQLADIIDVKHNSISDWENNLHSPNTEQIKKLCEVLEIQANYLYSEQEFRELTSLAANNFLSRDGKELPEEAKKELDNFIEYLKTKYKNKPEELK